MRTLFAVRPLVYTWPYLLFWVVAIWVFLPEMKLTQRDRASAARPDSPDRGSMKVIVVGGQIAMWLAVLTSGFGPTVMRLEWRVPAMWIGGMLLVSGSLLRRHCWRMLGEFFTGDVKARADQPVIDRGAYRWVRHPSYTGGLLIFTGLGVAFGNWLSLALLVGSTIAVYIYRVRIEEKTLLATIGQPYARFMATRKRFIPFVL
jgi:protein-S-isoprenylcysteine O-methyltransferase Ste14